MLFNPVHQLLALLRKRAAYVCFILFFIGNSSSFSTSAAGPAVDSLKRILPSVHGIERVRVLNELAAALVEEEPGQALSHASDALSEARKESDRPEEAKALKTLGDAAIEMDNFPDAVRYLRDAASISLELSGELSSDYIDRTGDIGYCYLMMSRYEYALDYFQKAADLAGRAGDLEEVANSYSNIGTIYVEWGDYGKAVEAFGKAMQLDKEADQKDKISTDLNNIGKMYELWGKFEQAVDYYRQALAIEERTGNRARIAVRLNNLGTAYKLWGRYTEALDYFQQALAIERSLGDLEKTGKRLHHIGMTYLAMGQYDKSKPYLDQARSVFEKMGLHDELARLFNSYGQFFNATGNYAEAIKYLEMSRVAAAENNLRPLLISNYEALSVAYERSGMAALALKAFREYVSLKDSVFTGDSDRRLAEFRARLENDKIKMEKEVLQKEAESRMKTNQLIGTLLVSVLLILIAVIFILRLRARNLRQAKEISDQQADKYLRDLEIKNKELTYNAMCIVRNNETISRMVEKMEAALDHGRSAEDLEMVLQNIRGMELDHAWQEFEVRFTQVHKEFYDTLNHDYPDLTPNEKKLCAFLRLNMTTKDIASITHQSVHSINVARTRLRKKLNLVNSDENLVNFLMKY